MNPIANKLLKIQFAQATWKQFIAFFSHCCYFCMFVGSMKQTPFGVYEIECICNSKFN